MLQEETTAAREALGLRHKYLLGADPTAPLVFLVHGRAGNFDVMWTFRRMLPEHLNFIAPQAPLQDPIGGHSWWQVTDGRHSLTEAAQASSQLTDFIKRSPEHYGLAPRSCIALGFSQGAGLLSLTIQRAPQSLKAVALLAGFVLEEPQSLPTPPLASVLMLSGTNDEVIPIEKARQGAAYLKSKGFSVELHEDPVGHKVGAPGMRRLAEWAKLQLA
ncbi:MAG: hypothetical protein J0M12_11105 [Deltaproteobacteria bacterium]|nr:hypothetical protein [Deltaproteobacteria bacterium]